ncbi:MAG TPA: hypothetical protein ENG61_01640 [Candidatus Korarchaeota archaeon]|nr:hypothetical protein [Candidatus Korarchaeota archaeon]
MVFFGLGIGKVFSRGEGRGWRYKSHLAFLLLHLASLPLSIGKEATLEVSLLTVLTSVGFLASSFLIIRYELIHLVRADLYEICGVERKIRVTITLFDLVSLILSSLLVKKMLERRYRVLPLNVLLLLPSTGRASLLVLLGSKWLPVLSTAVIAEIIVQVTLGDLLGDLSYTGTSSLILILSFIGTRKFSEDPAYFTYRSMVEKLVHW